MSPNQGSAAPCPWCRAAVEVKGYVDFGHFARCQRDKCAATGPTRSTRVAAIRAWNRVAALVAKAKEGSDAE